MKQRYILPALLLLCSACQQEEWAQPEADSPDAIHFAAPVITVEKLTRSTFHDAFPTGGTFGVLGYCVLISVAVTPKRTGHRAARTGVTRAATPSPTCSSIKPSPTTARPALMTIITVAAREMVQHDGKSGGDLPRQLSVHLFRLLPEGRFYSGKSRQRHHTGRAETDVHHAVRRDGRCSDYHVERHADTRRDGFRRL